MEYNFYHIYILFPLQDFKNGILNLIYFFKVIWNFRTWSHTYTLEVLKKMFEKQHDNIKEYSDHANKHKEELPMLSELIQILDRILKDEYAEQAGVQYDNMNFDFVLIDKKDSNGNNLYEMKSSYKNGYTEELYKQHINLSIELKKKDVEKFGELMKKVENFWY